MLSESFFQKPTLEVAKNLIGKTLVRRWKRRKILGIITETEAYLGFHDKASHATRGRTNRTDIMFAKAGYIYVYLIYGMYHCLNIVTEKKDFPSAVLIRGVKLPDSVYLNGPGKVCRHFHIDRALNREKLGEKAGLWIEHSSPILKTKILKGPRIGVHYAGVWANKLWRFYMV